MDAKAGFVLGALALWLGAMPLHAAEPLVIGGTGSAIGVVRKLAEAYQDTDTTQTVEVLTSLGTSGGLRALADGQIDIALVSRALTPQEREGLHVAVLARTPLAFVANQEVTASGLSTDALIAFYRSTRTRWPDGAHARPVLRPWHDAETQVLAAWSEPLADALSAASYRTDLLVTLTTQENLKAIEQTPGAFGYAPLAEVVVSEPALRVLTFEGVAPTPAGLAAGRYPLAMTLAMVTGPASAGKAQALIDFVRSPTGTGILTAAGCLPLSP